MENLQHGLANDASFMGLIRSKSSTDFYNELLEKVTELHFEGDGYGLEVIEDPSKPIGAVASVSGEGSRRRVVFGGGLSGNRQQISGESHQDFYAVRGYLTLNRLANLSNDGIVVGEPAILSSLLDLPPIKSDRVLYVRTSLQYDSSSLMQDVSILGAGFVGFDEHLETLIQRIKGAEIVISDGVIGLAIADAFGVPNVWHQNSNSNSNAFQVMDYFSGVGRPLHQKLSVIPTDRSVIHKHSRIASAERIEELTQGLLKQMESIRSLQKSFEPVGVLDSAQQLGAHSIQAPLPEKGIHAGKLEIEYRYSGDKDSRQILLSPELVLEDGRNLEELEKLPGFYKSSNAEVGFFQYIHLEKGAAKAEVQINLPGKVWCRGFRIMRWSDRDAEISISKITLHKFW